MAAIRRPLLLTAGWLCFALGMIGIALPLMPTTIFWIIALWCWTRSAPNMARRILAHPKFGPGIERFLDDGSMSRQSKTTAISSMAAGYALWWLLTGPTLPMAGLLAVVLGTVALWMIRRPEPRLPAPEPALGMEAWVVVPSRSAKYPPP